jgi:hypothetical protein
MQANRLAVEPRLAAVEAKCSIEISIISKACLIRESLPEFLARDSDREQWLKEWRKQTIGPAAQTPEGTAWTRDGRDREGGPRG